MKKIKIYIVLIVGILIVLSNVLFAAQSQVKPNGIYKMLLGEDSSKAIGVTNGNATNNEKFEINTFKDSLYQKFYFEYQTDGYYKITVLHTGKSLTAKDNKIAEGIDIVQADYKGSSSQKWVLRDSKKNGWIISPLSNEKLAISVSKTITNGSKLVLSKTEDNSKQMFYLYNLTKIEKTKANGTYKMVSCEDSSKAIGVANASTANNANLNLSTYGNNTYQKFYFEYQTGGYYKITVVSTGKSLTVKNNNISSKEQIVQDDYKGNEGQKWAIIDSKINGWVISPLSKPNLAITIENTVANGSKMILEELKYNNRQMFYLYNLPNVAEKTKANGMYKIASCEDTSKAIGVANASTANNANLNLSTYGNNTYQKFYFEYQTGGYYKITVSSTGKSLTVKNNNISSKEQIVQDDYKGNEGQKWAIIDSKINGWVITPLSKPNLAITIENTVANGSKMILEELKYNNRQMFYLYNLPNKAEKTKNDGIYKVVSCEDTSKAIGVANASTANNAYLNLLTYGGNIYQKLKFEYQTDGYYKITVASTGKSLTVKNNNITSKEQIVQADYKGDTGQKWAIIDSKINGWVITPLSKPNLAITIENTVANGSKIILEELKYNNRQMFYLYNLPNKAEKTKNDGIYKMVSCEDTSKAIGVANASTANNANLNISTYENKACQKFKFEYQTDGYYKIIVTSTGKSLTVKNNNITSKEQIVQADYKGDTGQKWAIIDSKINGWIITPLSKPSLAITIENTVTNGSKMILEELKYNNRQMFYIFEIQTININSTKYPGYKEKLEALLKAHPNWNFKFLYTGLKFSDVVEGEYSVRKRNLVPRSYSGEWICGTTLYDTGWYGASEKAIAYYMDPRNFLDDINIFQFQDVNEYIDGACTLDGIKSKVSGTFLSGYENDINGACLNKNVNPYYIIARLIQEQGTKGGSTVKMKDGDKYYYNPFNIGASGDSTSQVIANALAYAKREGWDTMQKALEGGIYFCKVNWLDNYQNTLYQNKFDIDSTNGTSLYSHQYMQNLLAAYSEARTLYNMYKNTNTVDSKFTFIIPLYENMDKTVSQMPSNTTESYPINVKTTGANINLRSDASTNSSVVKVIESKGTVLLSVQRGINSSWNKIVLPDGTIGYMSGDYLTQVDDVKTCNFKAVVKTNDGDGCKIRVGPGLKLDMINILSDGTEVTIIDNTTYKGIDGYDWYRVVLSSGTQGFMPGKYLAKVN